jgi:Glycosyltransferase family 20
MLIRTISCFGAALTWSPEPACVTCAQHPDQTLVVCCTMSWQVGWFLHTPFPSSEIYRTLPVREEVLRAVLRADLIGFHTYDYARHFVSAGTRILGLEVCCLDLYSPAVLASQLTESSLACWAYMRQAQRAAGRLMHMTALAMVPIS